MTIQNSQQNFRDQTGHGNGGLWSGIKRWNAAYPRLSRVLWICLALLAVAGIIWLVKPAPQTRGFGGPGGRFGNQGPQAVGVARAVSGPINVTLNELGTVTPLATASVRPQVSGLLIKLNFVEGQMVKAGDVLAQIDPRPYQAALDQAKGQLARDSATLANAKVDLARYQALAAQNAISNQQLSGQQATVRADTGVVQADQANVETASINLGYTRIVSPIDGRAGLHLVDVGNIVSAGQSTGIVVVTSVTPISVLFTVPEDSIGQIMSRVNSGATLSVDAYDRSQTNKIASGRLATVDNVIDPTTGTVKLRALFDNSDGKLFPSQFVNVKLLVDTLQDQTVIPVAAVQRGSDGTFVFAVMPDKTVAQRTVKLGIQDGDMVAVSDGLKPGDTVVVDGADRLRDGQEISIPNQSGTIAAPSGGANSGDAARAAQRAQRTAILAKSCSADIAKLCNGATASSPTAMRCLFQNRDSLSSGCTAAMAKLPRGGRRGGGGGGGFGGGR